MYDNSLHVNPSIRNFWKNLKKNNGDSHPFKKNRNLVFFGDSLSRKSFEYINQRMEKLGVEYNIGNIQESFFKVMFAESGKTINEELKNLAVETVSCIFPDIPEDIFNPSLNEDSNIELNKTEEKNDGDYDYDSLSQDLKNKINKRILLNCLVQGASIHSYYTLHHLAKEKIDNINPELMSLYDNFTVNSVRSYFSIDYSAMLEDALMAQAGALGSSKVEFDEDNDGQQVPKITASAKSFPVLCQELVKGAMELITMHSLEDESEEDLKVIYYFADKRVDEPKYIQIGSEVWRNILNLNKTIKMQLPELVMKISLLDSDKTEMFFESLFEGNIENASSFLVEEEDEEEEIKLF